MFASIPVHPQNLLMLEGRATVAARSFLKSFLIVCQWSLLILSFSSLSVVDQASKSVPNFLGFGGDWLWPKCTVSRR